MSDELSGKLAAAFRDAMVAAHHETADSHHAKTAQARTDTMETWERELSDTIKSLEVIDFNDPTLPEPIRKLFAPLNKPQNQTDFFVSVFAILGLFFTGAAAASSGIAQTIENSSMRRYGDLYPDPATSAAMWVRDIISETQARGWMDNTGTRRERADALKKLAWNHLPPEKMVEMYRRGKMTDTELMDGLKLHGIPDSERADLLETAVGPLDYGTAVAAVTQNQMTIGEFAKLLPTYGIDPIWADTIYESAGATMPPDMAMRLFREGWIDQAKFEEILTESNLKNKYVPLMANLQYRFPPMEQTLRMLRNKIISADEALTYLNKLGFFPKDAQRLVDSVSKGGGAAQKNLTPSVIERLYEVGRFSRSEAEQHLTALGYDATEADLLLFLADESKQHAAIERAATSIGTRYVSWKIDRTEAVTLLDRINYPSTHRDELLAAWDARREAQTAHLTEAFLHKAWKVGAVTTDDVRRRLLAMGYDETDTDIIMRTDFNEAPAKPKTRDLTRADETKRYNEGIIDLPTFKARLMNMGYDNIEADQIIELNDIKQAAAAEKAAATAGV